jgi:hypothetical protein
MNSAKPPPPPQRPGTSRPPPLLRASKPPGVPVTGEAGAVAPPVVAAPPVAAQPGQETRLRVSVKLSVRDPNLLLARPLAEGDAAPPGTRAAVLVLIEPAVDAESRSGGSST